MKFQATVNKADGVGEYVDECKNGYTAAIIGEWRSVDTDTKIELLSSPVQSLMQLNR